MQNLNTSIHVFFLIKKTINERSILLHECIADSFVLINNII